MGTVRRTDGFTLPELLVATLIASAALASLVSFAAAQGKTFRLTEERLAANQRLRLILEMLSGDLRRAGFDARGTALNAVAAAGQESIALQQDTDGNGLVDSRSEELIIYAFRPALGTLSRRVGHQSMPLAEGLPADGFQLSYIDAAGTGIAADGSDLDASDTAAIRRVRVRLRARNTHGEPLVSIVTEVTLRNRPWRP